MKELKDYIQNAFYPNMKLTESQKQILIRFDRKYNDVIMKFRDEHNGKDILNFKKEKEKFLKEYHKGNKYFPLLEFNKDKIHPLEMKKEFEDLLLELESIHFDCILWKYYKQLLNFYLYVCDHLEKKYDKKYFTVTYPTIISDESYKKALNILKTKKYIKNVKDGRDIDSKEAKRYIEDAIKECGYDWKVEIHDNMIPRMNVLPNKIVRINKNAKFSKIDIEGLIAHEIKGHVGRRFYGYKSGLYLFVHGLPNRNILDEGLAVWNSINTVNVQKPNILYNIAFKCFIAYNAQHLDFYDLFELCKKTCPEVEEEKIVGAILRNKRDEVDTRLLGGDITDASYFIGYEMIDKMTDKERDDILKYNVGPEQIKDIPKIKEFIRVNKFQPIK